MTTHPSHAKTWEVVAAFTFGCVFVVVILAIAFFRPTPTPFEYTVFRITMALAAAGVGAVLPGFLDVRLKNWLRAGGALALFVVVYFFSPVPLPENRDVGPPPAADAMSAADGWLKTLDAGSYADAYNAMAEAFKHSYSQQQFENLVGRERSRLGTVRTRELFSTQPYESPPGAPPGHYRQFVYRTIFVNEPQAIYEAVILFGERNAWRPTGYFTMIRTATGQFAPYDSNEAQTSTAAPVAP